MIIIALAKTFLLLFQFMSEPVTYYVSYSKGCDLNDGVSDKTPWKTVAKVMSFDKFSYRDTIKFMRGDKWETEYNTEQQFLYIGNNIDGRFFPSNISSYGSMSKPKPKLPKIYIDGFGYQLKFSQIHFYYGGKDNAKHSCFITGCDADIEFDNCYFENNSFGDACLIYNSKGISLKNCGFQNGMESGITINKSSDCLIENCDINGLVNGVLVYNQSKNNIIRHNRCYSSKPDTGAALELGWDNPSKNIVYGNTISGNFYGLFISGTKNIAYNNIVIGKNIKASLVLSANKGKLPPKCAKNKIYNNTFVTGGRVFIGHFINPKYFCEDNEIKNNIFFTTDGASIQFTENSSPKSVDFNNNCYIDRSENSFKVFTDGIIVRSFTEWKNRYRKDTDSVNSNPLVNFSTGKPWANSPCVGKGQNLYNYFNDDYQQSKRKNSWDIGAYKVE